MLKIFISMPASLCEHAGKLQMYVPTWQAAAPERISLHITSCTLKTGILQKTGHL